MAASFPASTKTFSNIVDGTDFMEGDQMNQAYDEIEAIQAMLGALGSSQSNSDSLTSVMREYRRGCKVISDTVAQIKVEAGEVICVDSSGNKKLRRNTSETTVTWADIDTGAEAASKRYYVHAMADSAATTFTVVISLSSTAPTGVTTFKLLGSFFNNSGSDIEDVMDDLHLVGREPGTIQAWPTDTPPGGAILCDGSATVGTTVDPTLTDLHGVIGTTFGGADATDFQVPDLRGRTIIGTDDMGGSSADRMTAAAADNIGGSGGSETHTLTTSELAAHTHSMSYDVRKYQASGGTGADHTNNTGDISATVLSAASSGGGGAHANDQPWMALNYIIWK